MAILYPTLLAGVADWSHSHWRGKTIGIYRFWRDLGYGIAALSMATLASLFGNLEVVFYGVAVALTLSTIEVAIRYKEYIPRPRYWKTVGESIRLLNKESRVLIIDVREEWEFAKGHIDEAINIPLENLCHSNLKEVLDPETTYLLACSKGRKRSKIASKHLNEMGLTSYWIHGGTYSWQKKMVGVKV